VIYYCTAKFLQSHRRDADSTNFLKKAAAMVLVGSPGTSQALAWKELRDKKIDPTSLPPEPPPGHKGLDPEIAREE
jgi:hypothetical protein